MKKKTLLIGTCAFLATACISMGVFAQNSFGAVADEITPSTVNFSMQSGASVRLVENSNGLRFSALLSESDYLAIENEDTSYGMIIMPKDYVDANAITVENVFGESAVYDWATYVDGAWTYSGIKTRVINLVYDTLKKDAGGTNYEVNGAISNVLEYNITREFVGRAYIRYKSGENYLYRMADYAESDVANNTRDMLTVAKAAVADSSANAPTDAQKAVLKTQYIGAAWHIVIQNPIDKTADSTITTDLSNVNSRSTNVITGVWAATGTGMKDLDLTPYTEVKFYYKAIGEDLSGSWFEVYNKDFSDYFYQGNSGTWVEIRLTKEGDAWRLYVDNACKNYTCTNLSDIRVQLSNGKIFYVSDLLAREDPDYVAPVWTSTANVFNLTGTAITDDIATGYTQTVQYTTTWNKYNFLSFDLTPYDAVKFCVKSTGYYGVMADESSVIGETNGGGEWLEMKLVKVSTGWELFYGSTSKGILTLANNNLNDLYFRFGDNTYYVSNLLVLPKA